MAFSRQISYSINSWKKYNVFCHTCLLLLTEHWKLLNGSNYCSISESCLPPWWLVVFDATHSCWWIVVCDTVHSHWWLVVCDAAHSLPGWLVVCDAAHSLPWWLVVCDAAHSLPGWLVVCDAAHSPPGWLVVCDAAHSPHLVACCMWCSTLPSFSLGLNQIAFVGNGEALYFVWTNNDYIQD